ncbi:MAG: hypothetical protein U9N46_13560 [Euryarchaeota archaeon]|nr:hypothetical protein [Euryarchaeota archaeon]
MTDSCSGMFAIMALAVLLAGTAAGATWVVDDDGGADRMDMQTAEVAA